MGKWVDFSGGHIITINLTGNGVESNVARMNANGVLVDL